MMCMAISAYDCEGDVKSLCYFLSERHHVTEKGVMFYENKIFEQGKVTSGARIDR